METSRAILRGGPRRKRWRGALWPHGPLAAAVVLVGALNLFEGAKLPVSVILRLHALSSVAESLSAFGGSAQIILGLMLVAAGTGLFFRLVSAWALAVLLLLIAVGVSVARGDWSFGFGLETAILMTLLFTKRHYSRRTAAARLVFAGINIIAILAYGVFGSYLLGAGFSPPIRDLDTACYFTVATLSTVGFGDIVPQTPAARWFVVSLLVVGLGVFATAIATALGPRIAGELNRLFNPRPKLMKPKDHVILVGEGTIARNAAKELARRGIVFLQIVAPKSAVDTASEQVLEGDGTSDDILRRAGIEHASMVIAARDDDGENAFISLGAKDLNPAVRVLAVASSPLSLRRLKLARADFVFSPAAVGGRLLADLVEGNPILPEFREFLEGHPPSPSSGPAAG